MPELVTYCGKPVKRRDRVPGGLRLLFYHPEPGHDGRQLVVSQAQWEQYGRVEFFTKDQMPNIRALAAESQINLRHELHGDQR